MRRYLLLEIAFAGLLASCDCEVVLRSNGEEKRWNSATLINYGPQAATVTTSAVFLQGDALCSQSKLADDRPESEGVDVRGKIVVYSGSATRCREHTVYNVMQRAGAAGIVIIEPWDPPGVLAYRRQDMGHSRYSQAFMTIVTVGDPAGVLSDFCQGQAIDLLAPEWLVVIRPEHDTSYKDVFSGWPFLVVMRILAPAFAFWTAGEAAFEFTSQQWRIKQKRQILPSPVGSRSRYFNWSVRDVMYAVEVPALTLTGLLLACGQYGYMALPLAWHKATLILFSGASMFTTVLLALFIRDETYHVRTRQLRRPLVAQHPLLLTVSALICIGSDLVCPIVAFLDLYTVYFEMFVAAVYFLGFVPMQFAVSAFFFNQARLHQRPLLYYVSRHHRTISNSYGDREASVLRLGRLVTWLAVSAVCMLVSCYAFGYMIFVMFAPQFASTSAYAMAAHACIFSYTRIGTSFAQLQAIKLGWRQSNHSGTSMENKERCSVACLAAMRACDRTPLELYLKAAGRYQYGRSRVLPFFSSDTNSLSRTSDISCSEDGLLNSGHRTSSKNHIMRTSGIGNKTDLSWPHSPVASIISPVSTLNKPRYLDNLSSSQILSSSDGSSSSGRSSSSSNSFYSKERSAHNLLCSGAARASQPKLPKVLITGQSQQNLRSVGPQLLEPVCEDSSINVWQHGSPPQLSNAITKLPRGSIDDVIYEAAERLSIAPHGESRHTVNAAVVDRVALHASRLPNSRENSCSAGPVGFTKDGKSHSSSIGGLDENPSW